MDIVPKESKVIKNLYISSIHSRKNYNNYDLVVNCAFPDNNTPLNTIKYIKNGNKYLINIGLDDHPLQSLTQFLDEVTNNIHHFLNNEKRVLVHCQMGISRSATFVIAYLMRKFKWDPRTATIFLQQKRSIVNPNDGFVNQLHRYYAKLLNSERVVIPSFNSDNNDDMMEY